MNRHGLVVPALAAALLTGLTACSGGEPPTTPPSAAATDGGSASAPPSGAPSVSGVPSGSGSATGSTSPGSGTAAPDQSLGTPVGRKTASVGGKKIELSVYPVVRRGNLSNLTMTLTSTDEPNIAQLLSDNNSTASAKSPYVVDGIKLVDPVNKKLYLVAAASDGSCVCTNLLGVTLDPGVPFEMSASFAPPAAGVTAIDVQVPRFGTFRDVPVS